MQLLRRKVAASRTASRALLEEHSRNEALLRQLRAIVDPGQNTTNSLDFLRNDAHPPSLKASQTPDNQPLTTNTNFAVSQLPALRSLLAELRPRLAALKSATPGMNTETAKDELREERRGYIEQRTRSHLERNGQRLEEDTAGMFHKRVDPEEVQALETVASIFDPA